MYLLTGIIAIILFITIQVFDDLQLEAYDLNVDNLDVHAVRYSWSTVWRVMCINFIIG